ncbi:MAG: ribosomal RNA small subunit methyltransferase A [Candidatus Delongbacteria bacterium]|nr:ribosomal RNA small subunit methyltransferase A [Candidatus Delongbacteria bacterium]
MREHRIIKQDLERKDARPDKRLGQHFLLDEYTLQLMVENLELTPSDYLVEIGPGTGQLTDFLIGQCRHLTVVEKDPAMTEILREKHPDLAIIEDDILKTNWSEFWTDYSGPYTLVGNLPYNITTPILELLVRSADRLKRAVIMVQLEIAQRIMARHDSPDYARLSLFIQNYFDVRLIKKVSGRLFYPPTKVQSAVLGLIPRTQPIIPEDLYPVFYQVVKAAFSQRRKNLNNCLSHYPFFKSVSVPASEVLSRAGIDGKRRGETLDFTEFETLARAYRPLIHSPSK